MQPGNNQLRRDEEENDRGDLEELAQINAHAAFYEHHAKDHGQGHAEQSTQKAHELGGVERNAGKNGHGLNAFAKDHEKDKGKQAPLRATACQGADFGFNLAL